GLALGEPLDGGQLWDVVELVGGEEPSLAACAPPDETFSLQPAHELDQEQGDTLRARNETLDRRRRHVLGGLQQAPTELGGAIGRESAQVVHVTRGSALAEAISLRLQRGPPQHDYP